MDGLATETQRLFVVLLLCVGNPTGRSGNGEHRRRRTDGHSTDVGEGGERQIDVGAPTRLGGDGLDELTIARRCDGRDRVEQHCGTGIVAVDDVADTERR